MASTILSDNGVSSGSAGIKTTADSTGALALQTTTAGGAATTALTIDTSQNVGIGTASPGARLHVDSGGTADGFRLNSTTTSVFNSWYLSSVRKAYFLIDSSGILIDSEAASTSQRFATQGTERMRIDSSGNALFGITSFSAGVNGVELGSTNRIRVSLPVTTSGGQITFYNPNGAVGSVSSSGSATAYNTSSDYRLKQDIAPMTGALAKVAQLKPCTYKWKVDGTDGEGFIAHELSEICPNAVSGEKDAVDENGDIQPQGIDVSFLVATLTAAIQEQQALITALTARIETLENKT